jgi:Fe-S oxidoreductase
MYYPQRGLEFHPRNKNISLGAQAEAIYYSQIQQGAPDRKLLDELRRIVDHCTACGKCTGACSVKIKTAEVTLDMRAFLEEKGAGGHPVKSKILRFLTQDPGKRLPMAAKVLSVGATAQRSGIKLVPEAWRTRFENPLLHGPGPLVGYRSLVETLHLGRGSIFVPRKGFTGEAAFYFPGCGASLFHRSIGLAAIGLLLEAGVAVALPEDHRCCGYPLLVSGREGDYVANRDRNVAAVADIFAKARQAGLRLGHVLTSCGSCREGLSSYELAGPDGPPVRLDVAQYLLGSQDRLDRLGTIPADAVPAKVLYHPSCHAEWVGLPVAKASETYRAGLARLLGTQVALTPGCCGESGLGALTSPAIYNKIRQRKQEQLTRDFSGIDPAAPILVGCPSCRVGIERSLLQLGPVGQGRQVRHTLEYLAELLHGPKWKGEIKRVIRSSAGAAEGRTASAPDTVES